MFPTHTDGGLDKFRVCLTRRISRFSTAGGTLGGTNDRHTLTAIFTTKLYTCQVQFSFILAVKGALLSIPHRRLAGTGAEVLDLLGYFRSQLLRDTPNPFPVN